ncbi:MAG: hypothetical protein GX462_05535 [Thermotogaceae bacterium]|nr:hypothetical protein [Thermotogaceae bacterium]
MKRFLKIVILSSITAMVFLLSSVYECHGGDIIGETYGSNTVVDFRNYSEKRIKIMFPKNKHESGEVIIPGCDPNKMGPVYHRMGFQQGYFDPPLRFFIFKENDEGDWDPLNNLTVGEFKSKGDEAVSEKNLFRISDSGYKKYSRQHGASDWWQEVP